MCGLHGRSTVRLARRSAALAGTPPVEERNRRRFSIASTDEHLSLGVGALVWARLVESWD